MWKHWSMSLSEDFACVFGFLFVSIPDIYPFLFGRYILFLPVSLCVLADKYLPCSIRLILSSACISIFVSSPGSQKFS